MDGETLRQICRDEGMPDKSTVLRWLASNAEFCDQYARAREIQADHWADEVVEIADDGSNDWMERETKAGTITVVDHENINRSRLRVDTRKWLMTKAAPKKYGDKVTNELVGKDGGPIQTEELSPVDHARRVAFALNQGVQQTKPH